jgi:antitoxin component of MazEF toxin-antitoxin module
MSWVHPRGKNMLQRKVQRTNKSNLIAIPAQLCTLMGIEKGTMMNIEYDNNRLVMTPARADQSTAGANQTA